MLSIARGSLVAGVVLCAAASAAEAQLPQNIDYPIPSSGAGVTFAFDYTRGLNADAGKSNYVGIRFAPPWNKFGVWFGVGVFNARSSSSGNRTHVGTGIGLAAALLDDPLTPVTLLAEAGVGYSKIFGTGRWGIPIGITAIWDDPSGTGVELWIKPMLLIERGGRAGFATAAGFNYTGPLGFGFHLGVEWAAIAGGQPFAAGVGLQYRLGIPGPM